SGSYELQGRDEVADTMKRSACQSDECTRETNSGLEQRTARIRSVVSCPHVIPNQTSLAVPETLEGTAQHPSGIESPPQDRRRNGRQSHRLSRLSCARPRPIDRTGW